MIISSETARVLISGFLTVVAVLLSGFLSFQYGQSSSLENRKQEVYSNLLSEVMYFTPQVLVGFYPKTKEQCNERPWSEEQERWIGRISAEEWNIASLRIDQAMAGALLLAGPKLHEDILRLRRLMRTYIFPTSITDVNGPVRILKRKSVLDALEPGVLPGVLEVMSIEEWCISQLERFGELAELQQSLLKEMREESGVR